MSGYPNRLSRDALGPELRNTNPVDNPETDIPASAFNAVFHQVAGMNLVVPARALLVAEWNTGTSSFTIHHQEEAWNPKGAQARPLLARAGTGVYSYTFLPTYEDETEAAVPTSLLFARGSAMKTIATISADEREVIAWIDPTVDPLVVQIRLIKRSDNSAKDDARFLLEVM